MRLSLLASLILTSVPALSSAAGGGRHPAAGVVVSLESGDVACYITLKDDKGAEFTEMADFAVCEQEAKLVGRRVALAYEDAQVLADECQGDPDCKKTKTVALVKTARVLDAGSKPAPAKPAATQASFCTPLETVVFACPTGGKLVSVCGTQAYLQYRFGKPSDPLEMMLPEGEVAAARAASGDTLAFSGGGAAWLRFRKGEHAYVVYTGIGNWGPKGEKQEKQGVVVERAGKRVASLKCTGPVTSLLGPEWFEQAGVKAAADEDFELPD